MEEENKNEEVNNEGNQNFNEEQQVGRKKLSTGKKILIGAIAIFVAGIICQTYLVKNVGLAEVSGGTLSKESKLAREAFNREFEQYATIPGETKTEQDIKALISTVQSRNAMDSNHQITLTYAEGTVISARYRYTVEVKHGNDRYVNEIIITKAE